MTQEMLSEGHAVLERLRKRARETCEETDPTHPMPPADSAPRVANPHSQRPPRKKKGAAGARATGTQSVVMHAGGSSTHSLSGDGRGGGGFGGAQDTHLASNEQHAPASSTVMFTQHTRNQLDSAIPVHGSVIATPMYRPSGPTTVGGNQPNVFVQYPPANFAPRQQHHQFQQQVYSQPPPQPTTVGGNQPNVFVQYPPVNFAPRQLQRLEEMSTEQLQQQQLFLQQQLQHQQAMFNSSRANFNGHM